MSGEPDWFIYFLFAPIISFRVVASWFDAKNITSNTIYSFTPIKLAISQTKMKHEARLEDTKSDDIGHKDKGGGVLP